MPRDTGFRPLKRPATADAKTVGGDPGCKTGPAVRLPQSTTNSFEVFGGPTTSLIVYTTEAWRAENPKTYAAFLGAFLEASDWIKAHPEEAADTFLRVAKSDLDRELILSILSDGKYSFDPVPRNTLSLATFMHDVGALKTRPESWKDYFFEDLHDREGS